ncbi:fungal-specific transcription factor domain-containing protein [Dipodascopsis uninucleata]
MQQQQELQNQDYRQGKVRRKSVSSGDGRSVRRRISRACDRCNQLRTKCDGKQPCMHCVECSLQCEYVRVRKKRGKASKKDLAAQAAALAASEKSSNRNLSVNSASRRHDLISTSRGLQHLHIASSQSEYKNQQQHQRQRHTQPDDDDDDDLQLPENIHTGSSSHTTGGSAESESHESHEHFLLYDSPGTATARFANTPMGLSNLLAGQSSGTSPPNEQSDDAQNWLSLASPSDPSISEYVAAHNNDLTGTGLTPLPNFTSLQLPVQQSLQQQKSSANNGLPSQQRIQSVQQSNSNMHSTSNGLDKILSTGSDGNKYPVLNHVLSNLVIFMPHSLPYDLLETYFGRNMYSLAPLLRRSMVLDMKLPRPCSTSLIYALLLSAAYTSDNPHLTSSPSARQDIIYKLMDLCVSSLAPLHSPSVKGTLDDVLTYIHLGTVTSASEFKGSSLRWWHSAWTLARELKLNVEHPDLDEVSREEMRRTWWLLYIVDRHLGLCYNRSLVTLDSQSMDLYHPSCSDEEWASSEVLVAPEMMSNPPPKGITYSVTGNGVFGFFLPLMSILGGIVELHHLQLHPTFRLGSVTSEMRTQLAVSLEAYERSISSFGTENDAWKDYATFLTHVLHILLAGYWDPLDLLCASSSLLATSEFMTCTTHALRAADALKRVLILDPELMLMPFFFAIYLLSGSFIWLFLVDKLENDVSTEVREACETVVRAHEVCIVTLNTEYQRNFRRVIRGALVGMGGVTGSGPRQSQAEREDGRRRRREIVGLYRWCSGGNGLAV